MVPSSKTTWTLWKQKTGALQNSYCTKRFQSVVRGFRRSFYFISQVLRALRLVDLATHSLSAERSRSLTWSYCQAKTSRISPSNFDLGDAFSFAFLLRSPLLGQYWKLSITNSVDRDLLRRFWVFKLIGPKLKKPKQKGNKPKYVHVQVHM